MNTKLPTEIQMCRRDLMKIFLSIVIIGYLTTIQLFPVIISSDFKTIHHHPSYRSSNPKNNFIRSLEHFPWKLFNESAFDSNSTIRCALAEELVNRLVPFVTMEPPVPVNETCSPRPFKKLNCSKLLQSPRKVAVLLQFGFDVDSLEIHLNELFDIVDRVFILESYRAHFQALMKPLVWEMVKNQARFQRFLPKIVHFILDDSDMIGRVKSLDRNQSEVVESTRSPEFFFRMEVLQEELRWEKFTAWNNITGYFGDEDLVGIGDTDEIPSRDAINELKNCEFENDPVDIGIWFPFGNINQAFKTDFPVSQEHPFTLGDPTYWKLKTANALSTQNVSSSKRQYPTRNRGTSASFRLGGMHMSHYGYLPYQILKRITQSERSIKDVSDITKLFQDHFQPFGITLLELERVLADVPSVYKSRVFGLDELRRSGAQDIDKVAVLPWFYDCNRLRYPTWEGKHDTRLD